MIVPIPLPKAARLHTADAVMRGAATIGTICTPESPPWLLVLPYRFGARGLEVPNKPHSFRHSSVGPVATAFACPRSPLSMSTDPRSTDPDVMPPPRSVPRPRSLAESIALAPDRDTMWMQLLMSNQCAEEELNTKILRHLEKRRDILPPPRLPPFASLEDMRHDLTDARMGPGLPRYADMPCQLLLANMVRKKRDRLVSPLAADGRADTGRIFPHSGLLTRSGSMVTGHILPHCKTNRQEIRPGQHPDGNPHVFALTPIDTATSPSHRFLHPPLVSSSHLASTLFCQDVPVAFSDLLFQTWPRA